jgi:hypothetical protein
MTSLLPSLSGTQLLASPRFAVRPQLLARL